MRAAGQVETVKESAGSGHRSGLGVCYPADQRSAALRDS